MTRSASPSKARAALGHAGAALPRLRGAACGEQWRGSGRAPVKSSVTSVRCQQCLCMALSAAFTALHTVEFFSYAPQGRGTRR
jgi:hypothetical protein